MLYVPDEKSTRNLCCFTRRALQGLPVFSVRSNSRGGSAADEWELSFFASTDLMLPRLLMEMSPLPFAGCPPPCRHKTQASLPTLRHAAVGQARVARRRTRPSHTHPLSRPLFQNRQQRARLGSRSSVEVSLQHLKHT